MSSHLLLSAGRSTGARQVCSKNAGVRSNVFLVGPVPRYIAVKHCVLSASIHKWHCAAFVHFLNGARVVLGSCAKCVPFSVGWKTTWASQSPGHDKPSSYIV